LGLVTRCLLLQSLIPRPAGQRVRQQTPTGRDRSLVR